MSTTVQGSITLVDITDVGTFSVYPQTESPLSVIYDPDTQQYSPDWSVDNVVLVPAISYAGRELAYGESGVSVSWMMQQGLGSPETIPLSLGAPVADSFNYRISRNYFDQAGSKDMITFICTASYVDLDYGISLTATGKITFSKINNAAIAKTCKISGENLFKYDADGVLLNKTITLTVATTGVSFIKWSYKNALGGWTDTTTNKEFVVDPTHAAFSGDIAQFKAVTDDAQVYDIFTITKLRDGVEGASGTSALSLILGNEFQVIPCTHEGEALEEMLIEIPFCGYLGTQRCITSCTAPPRLPGGMSLVAGGYQSSLTEDGKIMFKIIKKAKLDDLEEGSLLLTFEIQTSNGEVTVEKSFTWTKSCQAANAILAEIYSTTGGNVFNQGEGEIILKARLTDGNLVTSGLTYQWKKQEGSSYVDIDGATAATYKVSPDQVNSYASFCCAITYKTIAYLAYYNVLDKTDPIQSEIHCSLGSQIVNGEGNGVVYTKVFKAGEEIDPLKTEKFLTAAPATPVEGESFYLIDSSLKSVSLQTYQGGAWVSGGASTTLRYTYTFQDALGQPTQYNGSNSIVGKIFYIDGTLFDRKLIINVDVETK